MDEYKRVMPLKLIKLKALQLVKLLILSFCLISLYFIYIHHRTSSYRAQNGAERFTFYKLKKNYLIRSPNQTESNHNRYTYALSSSSDNSFDRENIYFCLINKLNCSSDKQKFCPYVPIYLGKTFFCSIHFASHCEIYFLISLKK